MQTANLTNQKVYSLQFHKTKNGEDYATFSVSEIKPQKNGVYGKFYCQAFGNVCAELQRLKVKDGSIIDLIGEFSFYQKRDANGNPSDYGVSINTYHVNYSQMMVVEKEPEQRQEPVNKPNGNNAEFFRLANALNNNPFA